MTPNTQLPPAGVALAATLLKVLLALEPKVVIAAMQTTMIRASITAYSTAVGPSSFFRKLTNFWVSLRISNLLERLSTSLEITAGCHTLRTARQEAPAAVLRVTLANVLLALLPSVVIAA